MGSGAAYKDSTNAEVLKKFWLFQNALERDRSEKQALDTVRRYFVNMSETERRAFQVTIELFSRVASVNEIVMEYHKPVK